MTRIAALASTLALATIVVPAARSLQAPGGFSKSSPANGAAGQTTSPTLTWTASSGATGYEYCYDTTNDNACSVWTSTGTNTAVGLGGLSAATTYYWQVRAANAGVFTYAQGSETAFWSFTTHAAGPNIRIDATSLSFLPTATNPIYVELDWMEDATHSHRPSQAVIDAIVQTFAREGYSINIDVSNAIPHQTPLAITGSPSGSAAVQALKAAHFNHAGDSRYFYSLWVHNYSVNGSTTTSSGIADLPGSTHLVSLGSFSAQTGTFSNQVGTFVHEFGHNIGQRHGGIDHSNYKPNYASVMNYFYQLNGIGPSMVALQFANTTSGFNTFGYSHGLLPPLNEASLNENLGIGLGRARDWNCDATLSPALARDIQASNPCSGTGALSVLTDYDNWSAINAFVLTGAIAPRHTDQSSEICITPDEDLPMRTAIAALRAQQLLPDERTLMAPPKSPQADEGAAAHFFDVYNDGTTTLDVTGITLDVPAAWVTWEPQTFSVAPGSSLRVHVYVNFATMPAGQTTRRLLVASNDADESPYPGAVNLTMGVAAPGAFGKIAPANGASNQATTLALSWAPSAGATGYEYCYDTTNDNACTTWVSTGTNVNVGLSGLAAGTTFYWHARAMNSMTTYSDGSSTAFWSFTTAAGAPGAFNKTTPLDGAVNRPLNALTLSWSSSVAALGYEYCYDTTNDNACVAWTSAGLNTSATIGGLSPLMPYYWQVRAQNLSGTTDANAGAWWRFTTGNGTSTRRAPGDFDGDDKTDHTVFRPTSGLWYSNPSGGGAIDIRNWGLSEDIEVPGDYDGDLKADIAVWRPSTGIWYIRQSQTGTMLAAAWGSSGDVPFAADIDDDGKSDRIVWRPSTGIWYADLSGGGTRVVHFGLSSDVPIVGDWDGDDRADFGVWRPGTGTWYVAYAAGGFTAFQWGSGALGDVPLVGDWNGDGLDDFAVWRPSTGVWYASHVGGWITTAWGGVPGDMPLMGDWDGDGRTDIAIWRPGTGVWYVLKSAGGVSYVVWGLAGDRPIGQRSGR